MDLVHKIEKWGDTHHPVVLDVVRIVLGIFLLCKGVAFMENSTALSYLIGGTQIPIYRRRLLMALVYVVIFVHIVGGTLIALGTYTRLSSLIQIPIVFTAVFFVDNFKSPLNTELWYSVAALVLLIMFTIFGSGPLSLDSFLKENELA